MTNTDKVFRYLRSVTPRQKSNHEIVVTTGIQPHQQVFQITQRLLKTGHIKGLKSAGGWTFWVEDAPGLTSDGEKTAGSISTQRDRSPAASVPSKLANTTRIATLQNVKIVIQCAASKVPEAGHFEDLRGRKLLFVGRPEEAPLKESIDYARPDDLSDDRTSTWRERVLAYNKVGKNNPLGFLQAYQLYAKPAYRNLVRAIGVEKVFILSAGWGLIRADFLTPTYDITFTTSAERYMRRSQADRYADFCHLDGADSEPLLFLGGRDYQPLFERLTTHIDTEKVIFHRAENVSRRHGFTYVKYDNPAQTNWHYLCLRDLLAGRLSIPIGATR